MRTEGYFLRGGSYPSAYYVGGKRSFFFFFEIMLCILQYTHILHTKVLRNLKDLLAIFYSELFSEHFYF